MSRGFFIVSLIFLLANVAYADDSAWNCEKTTTSKEWVCVAQPGKDDVDVTKNVLIEQAPVPVEMTQLPVQQKPETRPKQLPAVYTQPPRTVARRSGWTCQAGGQEDTWDCSLSGADPKGQAKVMEGKTRTTRLLSPAFSFNQEEIFKNLHSELQYDPWESCLTRLGAPDDFEPRKDLREGAPIDVVADYTEAFDNEITTFIGNVEMTRADQRMFSDMANYDTVSETLDAQGNVYYYEDELSMFSNTTLLNLATDQARMRDALFISPSTPLRGRAKTIYRESKVFSRYKDVAYTSCRPGNQDWVIHASDLKMNKSTGKGSAKNAWLEFKGVPLIYTPYYSFPIDDRRLSGFLPPTWGNTEENGVDITVPYYWNIAPNYDSTLVPRFMSKRGVVLAGDFRYLTKSSKGKLALEFMPTDTLRDKPRYQGHFDNRSVLGNGWSSNLDLNYVSDKDYRDDMRSTIGFSTARSLRSYGNLIYSNQWMNFTAMAENYQITDRSLTNVQYRKLPQIDLNLNYSVDELPIDLEMKNQFVYFQHDDKVKGQRLNSKPSISLPMETEGSFLIPKFSVQHSQYWLSKQTPGAADSITRTLPIASIDSGLFFERDFKFGDIGFRHTIEPRLFYLYIPHEEQKDIPLFDTAAFGTSDFNSLFRESRYTGVDRLQDANQITAAVTTRFVDTDSGMERLKLSIGEIFYFRDRRVVISGEPFTNSSSDIIGEASGQLTEHIDFSSRLVWDPYLQDTNSGMVELRYRDQPGKLFTVRYRYRKEGVRNDFSPIPQAAQISTDISAKWPIYDNWYFVGRWMYSLLDNSSLESFMGLEKESCCWRFRVVGQRSPDGVDEFGNTNYDFRFMLQLELKGLTGLGDKVDQFLEGKFGVVGYQKPVR